VPAGTFNTIPVTCELKSFHGNTIRARTWFYSPAIGHYVKRVDKNPPYGTRIGKIVEYDLSGYIPAFSNLSSSELKQAEAHLQASLDKLPSGSEVEWSSSDETTSRNITIVGTFKTKDQRFCRDVIFNTSSPSAQKTYTTVFCRDTDSWKIAFMPTNYKK
jgi:surface antigen